MKLNVSIDWSCLAILLVGALLGVGVSTMQGCATVERDIATVVTDGTADLHTTAAVVAGLSASVSSFTQANPALVSELGVAAVALASKAGVSVADQATLAAAISPTNIIQRATEIQGVATKIAAGTATGTPVK